MRSFMSEKAREIISDPQRNKELRNAIAQLNETSSDGINSIKTEIGNKTYNIRFVNQNSKK